MAPSTDPRKRMPADDKETKGVLQVVVQVAVAILLPGVGFLSSQVIANGKDIAILSSKAMTIQDGIALIREHSSHPHTGAVTSSDLAAAIVSIEKQQAIRYDAIERQLKEIKEALKERK